MKNEDLKDERGDTHRVINREIVAEELPKLRTIKDVANYLKFSVSTIRRMVNSGTLHSIKISGTLFFLEKHILDYINERAAHGEIQRQERLKRARELKTKQRFLQHKTENSTSFKNKNTTQ